MTDIMPIIFKRRSIRHYVDRPVQQEQLTLLLQAGMAAPTACNSQPWEFEEKAPRTRYYKHRVYWQQYEPHKTRAPIKTAKYSE